MDVTRPTSYRTHRSPYDYLRALASIPDHPILVHSAGGDHASSRHRKALSKCDAWKGQAVGEGCAIPCGNSSDSSWWGTAVKTFFTVPYRKPGETFTACWNRAASDTLVGTGVPREATPGTEALLGSAGTVGLFSSVKSIWALGNWVRPSSYLAKAMGAGSAGVRRSEGRTYQWSSNGSLPCRRSWS
jgi:hypothetical protein